MTHRSILLAVLLLVTLCYLAAPAASQSQGVVADIATPTKLTALFSPCRFLERLGLH